MKIKYKSDLFPVYRDKKYKSVISVASPFIISSPWALYKCFLASLKGHKNAPVLMYRSRQHRKILYMWGFLY